MKFKIQKAQGYGYVLSACNQRLSAAIMKHMGEMTGCKEDTAYFQKFHHVEEFLEGRGKEKQLKELDKGYSIVIRLDPWIALHAFGWDCHTIIEKGF